LERIKRQASLKGYNVIFKGKVDQKELARLVRESWVNLHFSITEGWGLSIIEASASGTPTIAFRVPGVVDTIKDNENGFKVEQLNQFKYAIMNTIHNEEFFSKMSRQFAEQFNWENSVDLWVKLLSNNE